MAIEIRVCRNARIDAGVDKAFAPECDFVEIADLNRSFGAMVAGVNIWEIGPWCVLFELAEESVVIVNSRYSVAARKGLAVSIFYTTRSRRQ